MRNDTFVILMNKFNWIFNSNNFAVLVLFISLTIAASVVDLPEPVGPVTKTSLGESRQYHKETEVN